MNPRLVRVLAAAIACTAGGFIAARRSRIPRPGPPPWPDAASAHVPHLVGSITLDGDTDDPGWRGSCLRTGAFVGADGASPIHPYSEARVLWGDGFLYLNLYAADDDIHATGGRDALSPEDDVFQVVFTDEANERILDVNPMGIVSDGIRPRGSTAAPDRAWNSDVKVSHELDGTPNRPGDNDEEWVLEVAVPFEALGLRGKPGERIGLSMRRCDTVRSGKIVCGGWGERPRKILVLDRP